MGGGVVGLTLALEARRRYPDCSVAVLEKEHRCGEHGSTRNSGVLHAGFYYTADSHKARLTVDGNRRMTEFCLDRGLPVNRCGKLVVTRSPEELPVLDELFERGRINGVELEEVTEREARVIEPTAKTCERGLFSPNTSSVDPRAVVDALVEACGAARIEVKTGSRYQRRDGDSILTRSARWNPGFVINAAGLYADRIAHDFGVGMEYAILPFKGVFLLGGDEAPPVRVHVYPVPDLENPFLGVHITVNVDGRVMIGPSAMPALWREHYGGLEHFDARELWEIVTREAGLFLRNDFGFRPLAVRETKKYSRSVLVRLGAELIDGVREEDFQTRGRPGIRAQLINSEERSLVMDFCFERTEKSLHVLNAVSPAFTCCFSFASFLFDQLELPAGA